MSVPADLLTVLTERHAARQRGDFAAADELKRQACVLVQPTPQHGNVLVVLDRRGEEGYALKHYDIRWEDGAIDPAAASVCVCDGVRVSEGLLRLVRHGQAAVWSELAP